MLFYPLVLLVVGMIVTTLNLVGGSAANDPDFVGSAPDRNRVRRDL